MTPLGPAIFPARDVPLGGLRAMRVRRSLPQRGLPTVGAWCFLDRFGPQAAVMRVEPHPHMGLQTVTWPLVGEVRHRDTLGNDVILRASELNLMTSGRGIAHSEYSLGDDPTPLDALQLWIALPDSRRDGAPDFEHHGSLPTVTLSAAEGAPATVTVVMGTFRGVTSPATTYTPLVGAQVLVPAGSRVDVPLNPAWEHALVVIDGNVQVRMDAQIPSPAEDELLYLPTGLESVNVSSVGGAKLFLLGGEPFADELVMWWNFVGRSHEEIALAWGDWEASAERFGRVAGHGDVRTPAPPLPTVRLVPRSRAR